MIQVGSFTGTDEEGKNETYWIAFNQLGGQVFYTNIASQKDEARREEAEK